MSKLRDAILGFVVGDAFGVPYEFKKRDTFKVDDNMIGYGTHYQSAGTWSDDSSMMLATLYSIIYKQKIIESFLRWKYHKAFTPYGEVFDIGAGTSYALKYYKDTGEIIPDENQSSLGNGSLMRILPLAFFGFDDDMIDEVCSYTHPSDICKKACRIYIEIIRGLIAGFSLRGVLYKLDGEMLTEEFERLSYIEILSRDDIKSSGYVVDTLEAAVWAVYNSISYKDAIIKAVSLGDDTDTIAAIAGGMAGLIYGAKSIPAQWLFNIARLNSIENLIDISQDQVLFN